MQCSSLHDAISAVDYVTNRGIELDPSSYGALIQKLVCFGDYQVAKVLYNDSIVSRGDAFGVGRTIFAFRVAIPGIEHILDNKRGSSNAMAGYCGLGAGCSQLLSDMQAFKAANPGCILEDFIRRQSPPDWAEMEPSGEAKVTSNDGDLLSTKGQLSSLMQKEGNLWHELWETGKTVPAVKQAPLFDEDLAVEGRAATTAKATAIKVVKTGRVATAATAAKATAGHREDLLAIATDQPSDFLLHSRFNSICDSCRVNISISSSVREMAAILDTTLFQALLLTGQSSAAVELLKGVNYCDPLCGTDLMLVLEFSMLVLECCPTQTIELYLSGNILANLVNSYLKQHAPNMQAMYLELTLAMNENGISRNLQNEMVQIYLSEVLDCFMFLNWYCPTVIVFTSLHFIKPSAKSYSNIYLTLLQIDLNPQKTTKNFEKRITNLVSTPNSGLPRIGVVVLAKTKASRLSRKIAKIEGAEDVRISPSSTDSGRSDGDADDLNEEAGSTIMLDVVLDLLRRKPNRESGIVEANCSKPYLVIMEITSTVITYFGSYQPL
ncbi:hypothetical protein ACSBR1_015682 [Camellia fascicularis]